MMAQAVPATAAFGVAVYRLPVDRRGSDAAIPAATEPHAWNEPLLWRNAIWFCRLRWIVIGVLAAAGIAAQFPRLMAALGVAISPSWPWVAAGLLSAMNLAFMRLASPAVEGSGKVPVRVQLWIQIITDLLMLTAVIHWLGSGLPAAPLMYLFHIVLACIVFPPGESLLVAGLAAVFYLFCLSLESHGVLARTSVLSGPAMPEGVFLGGRLSALGVGPMLLIWMVIWYLVSRLAGTLIQRERELARTNLRLRASSEERAKHMLQTTHQLKAPFAAIHAHTQVLLGGYCGALPEAARAAVERIATRCVALSRQIQEMLQLANLRSVGQTAPPRRTLNLMTLIDAAVNRVEPAARQRGICIQKEVVPLQVCAVEDHLTMLLENLVENAVAYSHAKGVVSISCHAQENGDAALEIRDHGIGIPPEKLPRIFDDYYRTEEAVRHNPASTGLGLAIVRHVAQEANLSIQVESAPGWGTRFTVTLRDPAPAAEFASPSSREHNHDLLANR